MTWTEPITIIKDVIPNINPSEDFITVTEVEELMKDTATKRAGQADEIRESLRNLSRQLEAARTSSTRPRTVPSEVEHTNILQELAEEQMTLAKSVNEAQDALRSKEAEGTRLAHEARDLEVRDEASSHDLNSATGRWSILSGLGFRLMLDANGKFDRILVSSPSGDVHRVDPEEGKSEFELTNELWRLASLTSSTRK